MARRLCPSIASSFRRPSSAAQSFRRGFVPDIPSRFTFAGIIGTSHIRLTDFARRPRQFALPTFQGFDILELSMQHSDSMQLVIFGITSKTGLQQTEHVLLERGVLLLNHGDRQLHIWKRLLQELVVAAVVSS
jgi:hypothetical protein